MDACAIGLIEPSSSLYIMQVPIPYELASLATNISLFGGIVMRQKQSPMLGFLKEAHSSCSEQIRCNRFPNPGTLVGT